MADRAECSSMHPVSALLMHEPLSLDDNEITDKGYVNQRAVLAHRYEQVERLYATPPDPEVITAHTPATEPGDAGVSRAGTE
jgi:feruloyl-CoA synthase